MAEGEFPILALPAGTVEPPRIKAPPRGGSLNPAKSRQLERLAPQFLELQKVLDARRAELTSSALGAAPEHVLVFETNGPAEKFYAVVAAHPDLEWLLDYEDRVTEDGDFRRRPPKRRTEGNAKRKARARPSGPSMLSSVVYMVMFNQKALEQLLSHWNAYRRGRMPGGSGAWSAMFGCLRSVRRWGPEDRLREAGMLRELLEPIDPKRMIPVEIELWPRITQQVARASERITRAVSEVGGTVLDTATVPEIHYHALLVELPHGELTRVLQNRDAEWLQIDDVYLVRPTPQTHVSVVVAETLEGTSSALEQVTTEPVVALLDGLPMENHPQLRGHLRVDDPEDWTSTYQAEDRKHGTAMASLLVHGDQDLGEPAARRQVYVRPILKPEPDALNGVECAPRQRLWLDVIHQAVRRMVATDYPGGPVASTVQVVNLSVGDTCRPFLHEPSPLARLLDWLSWKHNLLFVVSAGNHSEDLPSGCAEDQVLLHHVFERTGHRRLLSPAESVNALTVGALNVGGAGVPPSAGGRIIPARSDLPTAYSGLGRGMRRSVKPDILAPGGRQLFREKLPIDGTDWRPHYDRDVGHVVAVPGPIGRRSSARLSGTSNAAALTSRLAGQVADVVANVAAEASDGSVVRALPRALLVKALVVHSAEWPQETLGFVRNALDDLLDPSRAKDELAGLLGYGPIRPARSLGCDPSRATAIGGGFIVKDTRVRHAIPIPNRLHLYSRWRRLTVTLAWFTPINSRSRKYRLARLGLDLPKESPLLVKSSQVHKDATTRGTVQHIVLEHKDGTMNIGPDEEYVVFVECAEDAGSLTDSVPYALAVSLEVAQGENIPVYQQVAEKLATRIVAPVRSARTK